MFIDDPAARGAGPGHYGLAEPECAEADEQAEDKEGGEDAVEGESGGNLCDDLVLFGHGADAEEAGQQHGDWQGQGDDIGDIVEIEPDDDAGGDLLVDKGVELFNPVDDEKDADKGQEGEDENAGEFTQQIAVEYGHNDRQVSVQVLPFSSVAATPAMVRMRLKKFLMVSGLKMVDSRTA